MAVVSLILAMFSNALAQSTTNPTTAPDRGRNHVATGLTFDEALAQLKVSPAVASAALDQAQQYRAKVAAWKAANGAEQLSVKKRWEAAKERGDSVAMKKELSSLTRYADEVEALAVENRKALAAILSDEQYQKLRQLTRSKVTRDGSNIITLIPGRVELSDQQIKALGVIAERLHAAASAKTHNEKVAAYLNGIREMLLELDEHERAEVLQGMQ